MDGDGSASIIMLRGCMICDDDDNDDDDDDDDDDNIKRVWPTWVAQGGRQQQASIHKQ